MKRNLLINRGCVIAVWPAFLYGTFVSIVSAGVPFTLDEKAADHFEWGYRPAAGVVLNVSPPGFCWRPQNLVVSWELECVRDSDFSTIDYRCVDISMNVHCPPKVFSAGQYTWRYRGVNRKGEKTNWSQARTFTIAEDAVAMPLPSRGEILARVPKSHPRLFVRPEGMQRLRDLAKSSMRDRFNSLVASCDRLVAKPPPTAEPPKYTKNDSQRSESWRKIWWGNRKYTIAALDASATLGFTWQLGGKEEYGRLAKRILLDCAKWDPVGSTGYRYNDEAGMPYAYHFSRTYTFVYDLLSEEEREECRKVMRVRGKEMYRCLFPHQLWRPYTSHANRAWHFLGEVAIAFHSEIEEADDWLWYAMNQFFNAYPAWADSDGGWHEGSSYWSSYIGRFLWWADVMQSAVGVRAYDKPYFSKIGDYPLYLMPPGKVGGGFGDGCGTMPAKRYAPLVAQFAAQARNPYWQWYAESMGGTERSAGHMQRESYVGFLRAAQPQVKAKSPVDLPTSKLFAGIGQAVLNSTLLDASQDVQIVFKSSPFGTWSHGYESNNSFLLWAYGQRLLVRSGQREIHGSKHHKQWMWSTRSVNSITVDGQGQLPHSLASQGSILDFQTTEGIDLVIGEAGSAYRKENQLPNEAVLNRFTRAIAFVKPDLVIVYDRLDAKRAATFDYWLHAPKRFDIDGGQEQIQLQVGKVGCHIQFLAPEGLDLKQTNDFDPNPRPRVKLRQWHLTAVTPTRAKTSEFVTLFRPYRDGSPVSSKAELKRLDGGYCVRVEVADGKAIVLLPASDSLTICEAGLETTGKIVVQRLDADGEITETVVER